MGELVLMRLAISAFDAIFGDFKELSKLMLEERGIQAFLTWL